MGFDYSGMGWDGTKNDIYNYFLNASSNTFVCNNAYSEE
jgi:hypothetical protein